MEKHQHFKLQSSFLNKKKVNGGNFMSSKNIKNLPQFCLPAPAWG